MLALVAASVLYGCTAAPDSSASPKNTGTLAGGRSLPEPEPAATLVDARPAALINGRAVLWGELRPYLNEAAGAEALREAILDQRLEVAMSDAGMIISEADVAAEQQILLRTLSSDGNTALRLLEQLRNRQRLGSARYQALLRRSAMLRALVRDGVRINDPLIEQLYDARYGPKRQIRILTVPTLAEAQASLTEIRAGDLFAEVAVRRSTDASAQRGGLLEPFSRLDPSYPLAIRQAAWLLTEVDAISDAIIIDSGYAIVQLARLVPSDGVALVDVREDLERLARLDQERVLMDQLVQRILGDVSVTIFDESLEEGWRRGGGR
jgi:hypothetical protein